MTWHCFHLIYELLSPLHIGCQKVGNVQRTRHYIPARNLWAAATEHLTRGGFNAANAPQGDYQKIGQWVQAHCAFTYFFIQRDDKLLFPHHRERGLCYGGLKEYEFERLYLSAHVTTALDAATTSAEQGSLHEVEFIAPHSHDGARTTIGGWVFLDNMALSTLGDETKWRQWLGELQVGGERRYGFGQLKLAQDCMEPVNSLNDYATELDGDRPRLQASDGKPLLAHTLAQNVNARGQIEPLVGRETQGESARFGQKLVGGKVCWVPGSMVQETLTFEIQPEGYWVKEGLP